MSENLIIEEIKSGNREELAKVYRAYRSEFIAWITSHYSCSREDAREVYQVSILILYENILSNKLKQLNGSIKTYLFAIGKNKFLEFKKADKRLNREVDAGDYGIDEITNLEQVEKEQSLVLMERSLSKLGDPCKSLLELYYFHNKSMEEIAGEMNYKNRATAKNLKCKCMARLREIFNNEKNKTNSKGGIRK